MINKEFAVAKIRESFPDLTQHGRTLSGKCGNSVRIWLRKATFEDGQHDEANLDAVCIECDYSELEEATTFSAIHKFAEMIDVSISDIDALVADAIEQFVTGGDPALRRNFDGVRISALDVIGCFALRADCI